MDKKRTVRSTLQGGLPFIMKKQGIWEVQLAENDCISNRGLLYINSITSHPTELFHHLECVFHCFPWIAQERNHRICKHNYFFLCCCCLASQSRQVLATPWTVTRQAPPSMGLPRQEYWSGLPFPSPRDLPDPGIKPESPALAGGFFTTEPHQGVVLILLIATSYFSNCNASLYSYQWCMRILWSPNFCKN